MQAFNNDPRGYHMQRKAGFKRPSLPAGARGMILVNTVTIDPGMRSNPTDTVPIAPYSQHTNIGEVATPSTSQHSALTTEAISPVRAEVDKRMRTYDTRDYRTVRADVLHTSPEWLNGRAQAKANRYRKGSN